MKRVRVVTPIVTEDLRQLEDLSELNGPDLEVDQVCIDHGPASIESEYEAALAVPDTLARILQAERDGVDAVVIDCMGDPGMRPARELVSIPVIGPAEAAMHVACILGHRFSVVTVLERVIPEFENQAKVYGLAEKMASVRTVEIPVLELEADPERLVRELVRESVAAVEEDGAHVIVFGCTGMLGYAERVAEGLASHGHGDVPVIDPVPTAVKLAAALADLGLSHSKRSFPVPPVKRVEGYEGITGLAART